MDSAPAKTGRIASLDQFRGYTVAGMFLVNFLSAFAATPAVLKHHNTYCSYADTIMPQFFFAVGFAFRLTFGRRVQRDGAARAYGHAIQRVVGLALVAIIVYGAPRVADSWEQLVELGSGGALRAAIRDWFQTLMHIAITSLWVLPVIRSSALTRVVYMGLSFGLHLAISNWFYFDWVQTGGIDGGVLGFLAWTAPVIVGTLACDMVLKGPATHDVARMLAWGAVMMIGGWGLSAGTTLYGVSPQAARSVGAHAWADDPVIPSARRWETHKLRFAEPPFVAPPEAGQREENYWMMSQRAATLSYHLFGAGFSLALYALFRAVSDYGGWQLALFRTLGTNALVGYILHGIVGDAVKPFMPRDSPGWYVAAGFAVFFGINWAVLRWMEKHALFVKL
jgi:predicted acyltransferase